MVDIVFPPSSAPGLRPQEGGGRLINAFADKAPVGAPSAVIHRRSPGLQAARLIVETAIVAASGSRIIGMLLMMQRPGSVISSPGGSEIYVNPYSHTRGFLDVGTEALWILDDRVLKFDSAGVVADLGILAGTKPVTVARNNATTPNNVVVTENGCFNLFSNGPPTVFPDGDLPGSPTSVCDFNGYFVWSFGDGRIFASELNSTNVNALSFNTEQGLFVRRVVRYAGRLYALGNKWTGVYRDAGTFPFPFAREVTIPRGIVGTHAVAGWEAGWANELIWAGDDFVVYRLNGYTPQPISTDPISRDIQAAVIAGKRDLIEAFVYMYGKNAFWVLNCHDEWTWEYNLSSGEWNERVSYNRNGWKGMKTLRMFDKWFCGDQYTGELYVIDGNYFLEGTDPLIWEVESGVLHSFPRGVVVPRASFHCTSGVGSFSSAAGIDPKIEISWSLDGGHSYGAPVVRRLGGPGDTKSHPYVLNCGLSRGQGVRYKLRVSDPVHVGLNGGVVEAEPRGFSG